MLHNMRDREGNVTWVASKHGIFQHAVRGAYRWEPGQWVLVACGSEINANHPAMRMPGNICPGCAVTVGRVPV